MGSTMTAMHAISTAAAYHPYIADDDWVWLIESGLSIGAISIYMVLVRKALRAGGAEVVTSETALGDAADVAPRLAGKMLPRMAAKGLLTYSVSRAGTRVMVLPVSHARKGL